MGGAFATQMDKEEECTKQERNRGAGTDVCALCKQLMELASCWGVGGVLVIRALLSVWMDASDGRGGGVGGGAEGGSVTLRDQPSCCLHVDTILSDESGHQPAGR